MQSIKHQFFIFVLVAVMTIQSVVMAKAGALGEYAVRDAYGGFICASPAGKDRSAQGHFPVPACCIGGCILSAALQISTPVDIVLKISECSSEAMAVIRVLLLPCERPSFVYDARSPPHIIS
ncbi:MULTISPECIES: hypothetical protein [Bartonella]|uniref:hypothetical protein n=1 Tax=Bartonella TaxID=773 RepID=UPI0018DC0344|nr:MULTISPECIES: hypothetical protein [Bartonella]MBI0170091.1 hypothetical protein [Bartonella sp. W8167]MBI0175931.1 hypothetical protein [Bartonella apis]